MTGDATQRRGEICRRLGLQCRRGADVYVNGQTFPSWNVVFRNNEEAVRLFNALAIEDAKSDPTVRALAARFVALAQRTPPGITRDAFLAARIHEFVRLVKYQSEETETIRSCTLTLALGAGDCDDHAYLFVAIALACGMAARIAPLRTEGQISHAVAVVDVDGVPTWAETTLAAYVGEHPLDAGARLGAERSDITGT